MKEERREMGKGEKRGRGEEGERWGRGSKGEEEGKGGGEGRVGVEGKAERRGRGEEGERERKIEEEKCEWIRPCYGYQYDHLAEQIERRRRYRYTDGCLHSPIES